MIVKYMMSSRLGEPWTVEGVDRGCALATGVAENLPSAHRFLMPDATSWPGPGTTPTIASMAHGPRNTRWNAIARCCGSIGRGSISVWFARPWVERLCTEEARDPVLRDLAYRRSLKG